MREFLSGYRSWLLLPLAVTVSLGIMILLTVGRMELLWAVIVGGVLAMLYHYIATDTLAQAVTDPKHKAGRAMPRLTLRVGLLILVVVLAAKVSREALYAVGATFVIGYLLVLLAIIRYELKRLDKN